MSISHEHWKELVSHVEKDVNNFTSQEIHRGIVKFLNRRYNVIVYNEDYTPLDAKFSTDLHDHHVFLSVEQDRELYFEDNFEEETVDINYELTYEVETILTENGLDDKVYYKRLVDLDEPLVDINEALYLKICSGLAKKYLSKHGICLCEYLDLIDENPDTFDWKNFYDDFKNETLENNGLVKDLIENADEDRCYENILKEYGYPIDKICYSNDCDACKEYYISKAKGEDPDKPRNTLEEFEE